MPDSTPTERLAAEITKLESAEGVAKSESYEESRVKLKKARAELEAEYLAQISPAAARAAARERDAR